MIVFFARALQDVLGGDEQVRNELHKPVEQWDDIVVPVLLVHGLHDLWQFCLDGGVVEEAPM